MSEDNEPIVVVDRISKTFKLPHEKHSSLKSLLIGFTRGRRTYERQKVLDNISFSIDKGDFFGIVGRNGSGKSTLLKLLAGIYVPDKGGVHVRGSLAPFIELGVGFNPELTGRENVYLNGTLLGFTHKQIDKMYDEIVSFAEIEKFMDQKLKNYSSGMQVRLAFSIAIRAKSDILLIDEVLAVGDANFQQKCFSYFHELKSEGKTVIFVSHDMNSVKRFCTKAMLIDKGEIIMIDTPENISDEYTKRNIERDNQANQEIFSDTEEADYRKVSIKGVELVGKSGKKINEAKTGDEVGIKIKLTKNDDSINFINIGVGVHAQENGYAFSYNTQMDNFTIGNNPEEIILNLKNIPLLQGIYHINVACFGDSEAVPYDYRPKALIFKIYSKGVKTGYRGMVDIDHEWQDLQEGKNR